MSPARALRVFYKGSRALVSVWSSPASRAAEDGLERMKALVHERFPGVRHLTTAELANWLTDTNRTKPVLLDARSQAEFDVSHLAGARRIPPAASAEEIMNGLPGNRPIVLYCAVGYRSAGCATRLIAAGHTNVLNLEGSIFQWANEGRPLEHIGGAATQVHPYSRRFGKLLKPELRAINAAPPR